MYEPGARVRQIGGGRRRGTITTGVWSGYVTVKWDSGREESGVHIANIHTEKERRDDEED